MKKIIFTIIILYTTSVFSINGQPQWEKDVTTHGKALTSQEWTKKVTEPTNCRSGARETKLYEIGNLSVGFMRSHPDEWLHGKYLEYANSMCTLNLPLRITRVEFDNIVDLEVSRRALAKDEQEQFLKQWAEEYKKKQFDDIILGWIVPISIFYLIIKFYRRLLKALFSDKTTFIQRIMIYSWFFRGK